MQRSGEEHGEVSLSRDLPAYCVEALSTLLDLSTDDVERAWKDSCSRSAYRSFAVDADRRRVVHVPSEALTGLQRRVLDRLLYGGPISPAAYAGVPGRSLLGAASRHLEKACSVLKLDISEAFASTSYRHVFAALRERLDRDLWVLGASRREGQQIVRALTLLTTVRSGRGSARRLALGSPTSVAMFNAVCLPIDRDVWATLDDFYIADSCIYTRYVDDLVISSPARLPEQLADRVAAIIHRAGFAVNRSKTTHQIGFGSTVHGFRRTFRGVEPTKVALLRYGNFVRLHQRRIEAARSGDLAEDGARESAFALRGMDAFLTQVYESRGARRPEELRFVPPPAPERAAVEQVDEFWGAFPSEPGEEQRDE